MIVLFAIPIAALFGFGFLNPLWWAVAAVLIFVAVRYGRGGAGSRDRGGGNFEYRDYRDHRDRQDRWDRRYRRQRQGRWSRQDRRDEQQHR